MIPTCKTCVHWTAPDRDWDQYSKPIDPDTYELMATTFEVRLCKHPRLMFCERPLEPDGFAVADGSQYMANLYTAEDFGCIKYEEGTA